MSINTSASSPLNCSRQCSVPESIPRAWCKLCSSHPTLPGTQCPHLSGHTRRYHLLQTKRIEWLRAFNDFKSALSPEGVVRMIMNYGNWDLVRELDLPALNYVNYAGDSLLSRAIDVRQFQIAIEMCGRGVNPNTWNIDGVSPIHLAAAFGNLELFLALLRNGADLTAQTLLGFTVGHQAAINKDISILKHLASIGVDLHRTDNLDQAPPIFVGTQQGNLEAVQFLDQLDSLSFKDNESEVGCRIDSLNRHHQNIL